MIDDNSDADEAWRQTIADLYAQEEKALFNVVYRWVWHEQEALDLVQDAFYALWLKRPQVRTGRYKPYLYRTALNKAANKLRVRKMRTFIGLDQVTLASEAEPSFALAKGQEEQRVRIAIEQLPEKQKQVLLLSYFSNMTHADISLTLNIPMGTVASRLNRAQLRLKESLAAEEG